MIYLHATLPDDLRGKVLTVLHHLGPVRIAPCDHASIEGPGKHVIWGMRQGPHVQTAMRGRDRWFAERAWLTQADGFYLDRKGTNYNSSLPNKRNLTSVPPGDQTVEDFLTALHERSGAGETAEDYILLPLQMEIDTQTEYYGCSFGISPQRQKWIIAATCKAFPDERIVIRPHPREPHRAARLVKLVREVGQHGNVEIDHRGNSIQACARAKAVVGMNSTVLIEALTFDKPVCAMGLGVFTGCHSWQRQLNGAKHLPIRKDMMVEGVGDARALLRLRTFEPDHDTIRRFLYRLIGCQIPFDISREEAQRHRDLKWLQEDLCPITHT